MKKKVTIKDITAIVNTSPHTVSKALNNKPGVGQELREKIKQVAHELNYVPNIFGRGLSGKTLKTMKAIHECGLRIPTDIVIMGFDNLIFAEVCLVPLTTVNQDLYMLGATTMEALLNKVEGKENAPYPIMPEPYIVERQSV